MENILKYLNVSYSGQHPLKLLEDVYLFSTEWEIDCGYKNMCSARTKVP